MNSALLKYPNKSHRKKITLPEESSELAEFIGIVFGDGGINNPWQFTISLNSELDLEYSKFVQKLIFNLFSLNSSERVRPGMKCRDIIASSVSVVDFLVEKGAVRGDKIRQKIDIPAWISSSFLYECDFIRGLFDTDGGFYTHRHTISGKEYINLGFCFASFSLPLISSVAQILQKCGINPHITRQGRRISFYSKKDMDRYISIIGSSNPRLLDKYTYWRGRSKELPLHWQIH